MKWNNEKLKFSSALFGPTDFCYLSFKGPTDFRSGDLSQNDENSMVLSLTYDRKEEEENNNPATKSGRERGSGGAEPTIIILIYTVKIWSVLGSYTVYKRGKNNMGCQESMSRIERAVKHYSHCRQSWRRWFIVDWVYERVWVTKRTLLQLLVGGSSSSIPLCGKCVHKA